MQRSYGEMGVNHAGALRIIPTLWGSLMQGRDNHRLGCQIRTSGSHLGDAEGEQPSLPLVPHPHVPSAQPFIQVCSKNLQQPLSAIMHQKSPSTCKPPTIPFDESHSRLIRPSFTLNRSN